MIRAAYAILLIASLLACPFRCAGVVSAEVAQASCCAGCTGNPFHQSGSDLDPEQHEQGPQAPSGTCECVSCLCQGAVLPTNDDDDHQVRDTRIAEPWPVDLLPQIHWPPIGDETPEPEVHQRRGNGFAGRPLRLLIQSLQI